ncbi:phage tail protein, partial [Xanthomonas vasicola]
PIHQGQGPALSNYVLAQSAGTETVTLTSLQMPAHTHTAQATTAAATAPAPAGLLPGAVNGAVFYASDLTGATMVAMSGQSTSSAGGNQPHNNVMPTLTVQYCIATTGIFPQQA